MTKYLKKSYKHSKSSHDSRDSNHPSTNQYITTCADKHKCKPHNTNNRVNEIIGQTCTPKTTKSEPEDKDPHDSNSPDSNTYSSSHSEWLSQAEYMIKVKLSNMKYAANFPVTINNNNTISLFHTGATISCMSKACFDKLQPKPTLVQTHAYKVNGANDNSLGPLGTIKCTLEFPTKFQQQFIVCEHLHHPVILALIFCIIT